MATYLANLLGAHPIAPGPLAEKAKRLPEHQPQALCGFSYFPLYDNLRGSILQMRKLRHRVVMWLIKMTQEATKPLGT